MINVTTIKNMGIRGGFREGSGRKPSGAPVRSKVVRVLPDWDIDKIERRLENQDEAIRILREALKLKANSGGAIKQEIRRALGLLGIHE